MKLLCWLLLAWIFSQVVGVSWKCLSCYSPLTVHYCNIIRWLLTLAAIYECLVIIEKTWAIACRVAASFVTLLFWESYFKKTGNCCCLAIWKQTQVWWSNCFGMAINIQDAIIRFLLFVRLHYAGISWDYRLWSELVLSAKVWDTVRCSSFWVQDKSMALKRRHRTGTDFRIWLWCLHIWR
jgi:hypothetical protein